MKNTFKKIIPLFFFSFFLLGAFGQVSAQAVNTSTNASDHSGGGATTGLTYDCNLNSAGAGINGGGWGNCTFDDLVAAVNKIINVGTIFALAFTVVVLAYAGFKYMTAGDNPGNIKQANEMFVNVAYGIAYLLGAWMIVHLIIITLTNPTIQSLSPIK